MKNYTTYLLTVFVGFVVLTIGIASYAYYKFRTLEAHNESVRHTTAVIDQAEDCLYTLKDAEAGQRGYLLTRDPTFLPAFYNTQSYQREAFEALQRLTDDEPQQRARLEAISRLTKRRMQVMQHSLFARQLNAGADIGDSLRLGSQLMDSIRNGFAVVIAEERRLMSEREEQQRAALNNVPVLTLLLSGVALIILVLGYLVARRQHRNELTIRDELRRNNVRLSQQNQELEQFAYVTSHDLQEPMRKIQTLADRILYKHAERLEPDVLDSLDRIRHASERLRLLVNDVLQYARLRRDEALHTEPVDLNAALREALELLDETIQTKNAAVSASPLPVVDGVYTQWVQVFLNLVGNALKFAKDDRSPRVSITVERLNGTPNEKRTDDHAAAELQYRIAVADNGIGFEERFAGKVFQVFQRLHNDARYPGTGIGLALVNKIVQMHGGTIEAHSVPDIGTTIVIYIPGISEPTQAMQPTAAINTEQ